MRTLNLKLKCLFSHSLGLQLERQIRPQFPHGSFFLGKVGTRKGLLQQNCLDLRWHPLGLGGVETDSQWSWEIFKTLNGPAVVAAGKLLQSCPTLCDPRDGSPPGSPIPGILQVRTLEWVAISFSDTLFFGYAARHAQALCSPNGDWTCASCSGSTVFTTGQSGRSQKQILLDSS